MWLQEASLAPSCCPFFPSTVARLRSRRTKVRHYAELSERIAARGSSRSSATVLADHRAGTRLTEGCEGLEVTEEMKVTIAAQASLLAAGPSSQVTTDRVKTSP